MIEGACPGDVGPRRIGQVLFPVGPSLVIPLCDFSISEAVRTLAQAIRGAEDRPRPTTVGCLNMRNHVAATENPDLGNAFAKMDYVFPDGVGLQIGRLLLRLPAFERVSGT